MEGGLFSYESRASELGTGRCLPNPLDALTRPTGGRMIQNDLFPRFEDELYPDEDIQPLDFWEAMGCYLIGECEKPPELGPDAFDD